MVRPTSIALLALAFLVGGSLDAQHPERPEGPVEGESFRVYDGEGTSRSFAEVLEALDWAEVVLVGEDHDDVVGHQVEAELLIRAAQRVGAVGGEEDPRVVVLSLEMFERDVQYIVDEYLADLISEEQFTRSARPWPRYDTDYRLMVRFARAHGLPVVAANAPRRYVNRVSRLGPAALEDLPDAAKVFLPPLPYPGASEEYAAEWNALMADMMEEAAAARDSTPPADTAAADTIEADPPGHPAADTTASQVGVDADVEEGCTTDCGEEDSQDQGPQGPPSGHGMGNALHAQALWDAAMGHAVVDALIRNEGALVIHYAGSFHVQKGTGIPERVMGYRPGTRLVTVVLEPTKDIDAWDDEEHRGLADFVVLTRRSTTP
jgi:uncharacterized iron-regulated protein